MEQLYDAGDGFSGFALTFALGAALVAFGAFRFRRREQDVRDPSLAGAHGLIIGLLGVALLAYSGMNLARVSAETFDSKRAPTEIIEGCVTQYRTESHDGGRLVLTDFIVGTRSFHFNSSLWTTGYHYAADTIHEGDSLKLLLLNGRIAKLYRSPTPCPSALTPATAREGR